MLQHFCGQLTSGQLRPSGRVQVRGTELGKTGQLPVLGQLQPQPARDPSHGSGLGGAAHSGNRKTHIDRRTDPGVEEVLLQVNLTIGDGDNVGGDVGRNVAGLSFDDGQRGYGTAAVLLVQTSSPLQQTAVQVKHIAGVGLSTSRAPQQQRHLPVGPSVLGKVVIDHQHVLALGHEILGHSAAGIGCDKLEGRRIRRSGVDHNGVLHPAGFLQDSDHLGYLALLLPDGDVNADEVAALLVDDSIQGYGGLAGGTVADDQFPLAPTDGNHGVDGLDAGLHRRVHRLPHHHVGGDLFHGAQPGGVDRTFTIQRTADGVHHSPDQSLSHRYFDNLPGGADPVPFFDGVGVSQNRGANQVRLQVHCQPQDFIAEIQQLVGTDPLQTLNAGDAVTNLNHRTHVDQS